MPCTSWICGLKNSGMAICTITRSQEGTVRLTIDDSPDLPGVEVMRAPHLRVLETTDQDYGLAIVSCAKVMNGESKAKSMDSIDLSKLELTAFFSFMDPDAPNLQLSPDIALWHLNGRFKRFLGKSAEGRTKELWLEYLNYMKQESRHPRARKGQRRSNTPVSSYT